VKFTISTMQLSTRLRITLSGIVAVLTLVVCASFGMVFSPQAVQRNNPNTSPSPMNNDTSKNETCGEYEWWPQITAPDYYPAYNIKTFFTTADGSIFPIETQDVVMNPWGSATGVSLVDPTEKPLPVKLDVRWFDIQYKKGWQGSFDLPIDTICAAFKTAPKQVMGDSKPYDGITVGVAPGGDVAVWLVVGQVQYLVGMYKATPVEIALSEIGVEPDGLDAWQKSTLQSMVPGELQSQIAELPEPTDLWLALNQRAVWFPTLEAEGEQSYVSWTGFNGERDWFDLSGNSPSQKDPNSVPWKLTVTWKNKDGDTLVGTVEFLNPDEVFQQFGQGLPQEPGERSELFLKPVEVSGLGEALGRIDVSVKTQGKTYQIKEVESSFWKRDKLPPHPLKQNTR
jgi:Protein of unknown function (DUF2931)